MIWTNISFLLNNLCQDILSNFYDIQNHLQINVKFKQKIRRQRGGSRSRPQDMSIPLKLFLAISLERKSVFRDVRIKVNLDLMF